MTETKADALIRAWPSAASWFHEGPCEWCHGNGRVREYGRVGNWSREIDCSACDGMGRQMTTEGKVVRDFVRGLNRV